MIDLLEIPNVCAAIAKNDSKITVLDLETNGFMHRPTFGICEVSLTHVFYELGQPRVRSFSKWVNPGHAVDPQAQAVHAIPTEAINSAPIWSHFAHEVSEWLSGSIAVGYNIGAFDLAVILQQNHRYGMRFLLPDAVVDLYEVCTRLLGSSPGTLAQCCRGFGIAVDASKLHRADYDVDLSLLLLDRLIEAYGPSLVSNPPTFPSVVEHMEQLARIWAAASLIWKNGFTSERDIGLQLGISTFGASRAIVTALRSSLISPKLVLDDSPSAPFVLEHLIAAFERAGRPRNASKPIMDVMRTMSGAPPSLDYSTLEAAMMFLMSSTAPATPGRITSPT